MEFLDAQKENELRKRAANIAAGLSEIRLSLARLSEKLSEIEKDRRLYIPPPEPLPKIVAAKNKPLAIPEIAPPELFGLAAMKKKKKKADGRQ